MDRSIFAVVLSVALLILQSTQGAELNSEATLNCKGKEFKCVNSTHYQSCSLTERSGLEPQWMINGVVLPCLAGQECSDESAFNCAAARTVQPIENEIQSQIPVEVAIVQEPVVVAVEQQPIAPVVASPAKSLPTEEAVPEKPVAAAPEKPADAPEKPAAAPEKPAPEKSAAAPEMPATAEVAQTAAISATKDAMASAEASVAAPVAPVMNATVADKLKLDEAKPSKKKKFSLKGLKKVGPIRLVKGFRASKLRPKIALDSQKDVADKIRQKLFQRRNKYEKFVDVVLGKASPVKGDKQTIATVQHDCNDDDSCEDTEPDPCDDGGCDYDSDSGSNSDDCDDDDSGSSSCEDSSSSSSSEECDEDSDECDSDESDEDDDDDECDLEPGEGEAVWEEEEVEGGIEIVEECPDDEDDCDSDCCCEESEECDCDDSESYEYEDGIEETAEVDRPDDDCDDDSGSCEDDSEEDSGSCEDDDSCEDEEDSCEDSDEECKKKRKQSNKNKKKKTSSKKKKKTGSKKSSSSKKKGTKKSNGTKTKKKSTEKKKVRYPPVQKIRKSLARALHNVTAAVVPASVKSGNVRKGSGGSGGGGLISNAATGIQNAVLNKVDDILAIKDNGLFNKGGNSDTNTGCSIVEGWSCPRKGMYAHPIDCQKYVQCQKNGGPFSKDLSNTVYECEDDEAYDPNIRSCTTDWSSCEALEQCLYHRQLIEDPSDDNSYFICIRDNNKFKESYSLYRRDCTPGRTFDPDYGLCLDDDDYRRIQKAKRRRQQQKCQKKKAQKNKKKSQNKKKKSPQKKN